MAQSSNPDVEAKIAQLESLPLAELRELWRERFKSDSPSAFGPDLLRRALAHKVQEEAYGGLDAASARLLAQLLRRATNGKPEMPRRIAPGAVLSRGWKGKRHRVMVLESGFAYEGKSFDNLSEIARLITGTRWNGPRFFGLRTADGDGRGE